LTYPRLCHYAVEIVAYEAQVREVMAVRRMPRRILSMKKWMTQLVTNEISQPAASRNELIEVFIRNLLYNYQKVTANHIAAIVIHAKQLPTIAVVVNNGGTGDATAAIGGG
jgi:predicted membrane-bound dolichyl-phosphate-mannose-protein mannosyltransferase